MKETLDCRKIDEAIFLIVYILILASGVIIGSVYLMNIDDLGTTRGFLENYMSGISEGCDKLEVFKNSILHNMILLGTMFAAGFLRIGFIAVGACIVRKGFVMGFTSAAFYNIFGFRGILFGLAYLPAVITAVPSMLFYASFSSKMSLSNDKKSTLFCYIFVTFFITAIFCGSSLLEGYITTIFMKAISEFF